MNRYLIEAPHEDKECVRALQNFLAGGFLTHFEWGCPEDNHSGYAIIEAENVEQARMVVPPIMRDRARVIPLKRFDPDVVREMHSAN